VRVYRELLPVERGEEELPLVVVRGRGRGAAVVIMPSAFGVGADLLAQMAELAEVARVVVAVEPFFREAGAGALPYDDMTAVKARLAAVDRARAHRDLAAAIEWARADGAGGQGTGADGRVVVVGICFGGAFALQAAADGVVDGVVTWHGSRLEGALERAAAMRCPMRLHFGAVDPFVPMATVEAVRAAFAGRQDVRVVVHQGATHGFSHRGAPAAYDQAAERAGMDAVKELAAGR
jgi:carboxymethylenebutenolidase